MKLGIGLAGLGRMGRIHATNLAVALRRWPGWRCVYDADGGAPPRWPSELDVPVDGVASTSCWTACDAVAIATSTGSHAELTVAAAAGRAPGVLREADLARPGHHGGDDRGRRARRGCALQVGFHRRFDPDWVAVAERIHAGELGEVTLFRTSLRDMTPPNPAFLAGSGGFFADVTVHDLDVARWLVGEVVEVTAHGAAADPAFAELGDIDTAVVVLRFANGALGVIDNSRAARYGYECSTEVMGTRATARIDTPRRAGYEWRTPGAGVPRPAA